MTTSPHPILERAAAHGVSLDMQGAVAVVRLCRPAKRNALNDALIEALRDMFQNLPPEALSTATISSWGETWPLKALSFQARRRKSPKRQTSALEAACA